MTEGYSGTPLARKLGIKPGMRIVLLSTPRELESWVSSLPGDLPIGRRVAGHADLVLIFTTRLAELADRLDALRAAIAPDGMIWVGWPKRASRVPTDITENLIRDLVLPTGLVDVKVCAISDVWSGLKLVIRRELR
ncbi:DUF3052 family protein [Microlunatus panaciterrae]|uniref:DUF3052 domain-containing protein n=1 Tax=Microlunatus panaciterrae TaxID=400768 RepID=A0ABS2RFQ1_9ACTN|nr:DUF3052 family protein [Microlunatus panaciterrae]MBM7797834.1 hypothetical protein [Microlunatus panaciterrae]